MKIKKLVTFFLQLIIIVSLLQTNYCLSGCKDQNNFRAGAAVTDITPKPGVSLSGLLQQYGPIKKIIDPLNARCLVMENGKTRIAIVLCDVCIISGDNIERAKSMVYEKTGLPISNILIAATHTHMAPRVTGWHMSDIDREYYDYFTDQIVVAVQQAIDNLEPAQLGWGVADKPEYLENRRWIMKPGTVPPNPFGETSDKVVMGGNPKENRVGPAGPVDSELVVLSVRHKDGTPLAVLANYGIHYGINIPGSAGSDYFGHYCRQLQNNISPEESTQPSFVAIMSSGASGDVSALKTGGDINKMYAFADELANDVKGICQRIEYNGNIDLDVRDVNIDLAVNKPGPERLAWAENILSMPEDSLRHHWTKIHAEEALQLNKYPDSVAVKLQTIMIGNACIVAFPGEAFAETGISIKELSPFKPTIIISHANEWHGYIPPKRQHLLGGMEVWPRRASYLEEQATDRIESKLAELFEQMGVNN